MNNQKFETKQKQQKAQTSTDEYQTRKTDRH